MKKPNFFIIGAAKSGTSSLYHYIRQHPDVCMSIPKETWFFCFEDYDNGIQWYWNRYFANHYKGQSAIGEASPWYLHMPHVAQRISEACPDAKLIAILRNPVERAFSEWWMAICAGVERLPFQEAIRDNLLRLETQHDPMEKTVESARQWLIYRGLRQGKVTDISKRPRTYVENGYYAIQLERYYKYFSKARIKVFLFEDLLKNPLDVVRQTWEFIGVDSNVPVDLAPRNVAAGCIGGYFLHLVRYRPITARRIIPKAIKRRVVNLMKNLGEKPRIDTNTRRLLTEHYYEHNVRLAEMLGRDLNAWLEGADER